MEDVKSPAKKAKTFPQTWVWVFLLVILIYDRWLGPALQLCGWLDTSLSLSGCIQILDARSVKSDNAISRVVFSASGEVFAAGSQQTHFGKGGAQFEGVIRVWRVSDDRFLPETEWTVGAVWSMDLSPDGTKIVAWSWPGGVQLWETTPDLLRTLDDTSLIVRGTAFSSDGSTVAAALGQEVRVWSVADGTLLQTWDKFGSLTEEVKFLPDGATVAVLSENISQWRISDGSLLRTFGEGINTLALSPDGEMFATDALDGPGSKIMLWQASDGALARVFQVPQNVIDDITFSPDGKILASASRSVLHLWRVSDGTLLHTSDVQHRIAKLAYAPDDRIAIGTEDGMILIWQAGE